MKQMRIMAMVSLFLLSISIPRVLCAEHPGLRVLSPRIEHPSGSAKGIPASAAAPAPADASGRNGYSIAGISPTTGHGRSMAYGINAGGEVVGRFYDYNADTDQAENQQAFKWNSPSGVQLLGTLDGETFAWGINDNGFVSGYSKNAMGHRRAVRWDTASGMLVDIGTLTNATTGVSGDTSNAYDLNNFGTVVGNADLPNDDRSFIPFHAFVHQDATAIMDLGTLTDSWPQYQNGYSIAYDINESNVAVGLALDTNFAYRPFVWDAASGMVQLPVDAIYSTGEWYATALNNAGLIAGHVIVATHQSLPYYWSDRSTPPVPVTMPAGFPYGEIYAVNNSGLMVGIMWDADTDDATEHAFVYDPVNGVRDLNAQIDGSGGWLLTFARDINDAGQIVGGGEANGVKRAFVLTPRLGLTIHIDGQGTVTRDPDADGFAAGTRVSLSAVAQPGWTFSHWTGPVIDTASARTTITLTADETVTCVFIPSVGDSDNDGIADGEEQGPDGATTGYDGNGDHIADAAQSNVASTHTADGQYYITLAAESGLDLNNVVTIAPGNMSHPPANASFDWGFLRFTITNMTAGGDTAVQLFLPAAARPDAYYKYGPTAANLTHHWYEFPFDAAAGHGAEIDLNVVTLHLQDGGMGDDDMTADGQITDDGGPAGITVSTDTQSGAGGGDSGGGSSSGCFIDTVRSVVANH